MILKECFMDQMPLKKCQFLDQQQKHRNEWSILNQSMPMSCAHLQTSQIARFMGPTWGPPGSSRPQMGPMLAPWTLLSGMWKTCQWGQPSAVYVKCWLHMTHHQHRRGISHDSQGLDSILTHLPPDKMAAILQTIFSDAFSWMKSFVFWLIFHWSLFLRVHLTVSQHWFR